MGEQIVSSVTAILTAIVGLAILAVLVSKNANTSQVITSGGNAFSGGILAAVSPVTGSGMGLNTAGTYQSSGFM